MVTYSNGIRVEIGLTDTELSQFSIHLNSPLDYARIVIFSAKFFLNFAMRKSLKSKNFTGRFVIKQYSKNNNRVFIYHQSHKYVSFTFPFRIRDVEIPSLDCENWIIDTKKLDILASIIEDLYEDGKPKKNTFRLPITLAEVAEDLINNSVSPMQITMHDISILSFIMTNEPGYIRYDYDPGHAKGQVHPKHHLDINYSPNAAYKYGLYDNIDIKRFESIFEKDNDKQYLHQYHKLLEPVKISSSSNRLNIRSKRNQNIKRRNRHKNS